MEHICYNLCVITEIALHSDFNVRTLLRLTSSIRLQIDKQGPRISFMNMNSRNPERARRIS
jgi:hypothetical protein